MSIAPSYRPELLALPAEGSTSKVTLGLARTAGAIRRGGPRRHSLSRYELRGSP
jgi:hypothetical protein